MDVYFVNYYWFDNTSGIHLFHLANQLQERGVRCTVLVPDRPDSVTTFGVPRFAVQTYRQSWRDRLAQRLARPDGGAIVHAWTPREIVRRPTLELAARLRAPYLVHLEDNERLLYLANRRAARKSGRTGRRRSERLIHPLHWRRFLDKAAGITCIIDSLLRFCPDHVPAEVFWPACEPEIFDLPATPDLALRRSLGVPDDAFVLFYPGNIHLANLEDVSALYRAVSLLNQGGRPVWLLRTGTGGKEFAERLAAPPQVVELGHQPASAIPRYVGVADALVQPGRADAFNVYRFPCKLPMFLASGRPVVLPPCNIGEHLADEENCLITTTGSAEELAAKVSRLITDPDLRRRLGSSGRAFAQANLRWEVAADRLLAFYERILSYRRSGDRIPLEAMRPNGGPATFQAGPAHAIDGGISLRH